MSYKISKFEILGLPWKKEFKLPDGTFSVSDIQDYSEYIIKIHEAVSDNRSIRIYVSK